MTDTADRVDLPYGPRGVTEPYRPSDVCGAVRRAVAGRCAATGRPYDERTCNDALLVASELATNAILHGGGLTGYDVEADERTVHVSVSDRSERLPMTTGPLDERGRHRLVGRGWPIVRRLARDVRVAGLPDGGKRITAVVPIAQVGPVGPVASAAAPAPAL
ncbi:ATP-binding protein [Streptomyces antibioticus]|uniref:ATP-binding protein n=1 Tax=Streptomyces antibioticus TaxID=1890 RepID=UPI00068A17F0